MLKETLMLDMEARPFRGTRHLSSLKTISSEVCLGLSRVAPNISISKTVTAVCLLEAV
jgi:hypothetical protein